MGLTAGSDNIKITEGKNYISPCWNSDGDLITFVKDQSIWIMKPDGSDQKRVYDSLAWDGDPCFDVTGEKIFFASQQRSPFTGDHINIHVIDTNGQNRTQITKNADSRYPVSSPDGTYIAYLSKISGTNDIWLMDASGENRTQVTSTTGAEEKVSWFPSGDSLIYSLNGDLWISYLDGRPAFKVTNTSYSEKSPSVSPNGEWIAFVSDEGEYTDLWIMNLEGTRTVRLTFDSAIEQSPSWNPNGGTIAYVSDLGDENGIWLAEFELDDIVYDPADEDAPKGTIDSIIDLFEEEPIYATAVAGVVVAFFIVLFVLLFLREL
ncbi:TolB protein [Methanohalophilus levihalophilus]|uniref:TolB family protein n=1 Tax=Methanohalophilus levihalophilus TaxID=1431282 RepID=UPI001AE8AF8D|nr:TolB protein [Methanohalophilus levihalophilus]